MAEPCAKCVGKKPRSCENLKEHQCTVCGKWLIGVGDPKDPLSNLCAECASNLAEVTSTRGLTLGQLHFIDSTRG